MMVLMNISHDCWNNINRETQYQLLCFGLVKRLSLEADETVVSLM